MDQTLHSAGARSRPLRLEPFRALRYDPRVVPDLGAVTCPPYDVIGADRVSTWEAADLHNIVRLILPRGENRYEHAAHELDDWVARGVLRADERPGLYIYEHVTPTERTIGLVGAVSLHDPRERRILPHENVFPGPVRDRAALMTAVRAQLEPILLSYDGGGMASDIVDALARTTPLVEAETADDHVHRIWVTDDPADHAAVAADLADRQALIADGHHRYAAYRTMAETDSAATGLAMLVDIQRHPLALGAIHRSVAGLTMGAAVDAAERGFAHVSPVRFGSAGDLLDHLDTRSEAGVRFVISDGHTAAALGAPHEGLLSSSLPADRSQLWRGLDASIGTEFVLGALWRRPDDDPSVSYHHRAADAVERARSDGGVALLLAPPDHRDVLAIAQGGERMPRKSTSFGPKPRTGLLMRRLRH